MVALVRATCSFVASFRLDQQELRRDKNAWQAADSVEQEVEELPILELQPSED